MSFLVKAEAVKGPLGWLLINVGQYALVRGVPGPGTAAARRSRSCKAGGAIGIFPEGTRGAGNVDDGFRRCRLAGRAGRRAVRAGRDSRHGPSGRAQRRRFRPEVHVLVGDPFAVPHGGGRTAVTAATEAIR